MRCYDDDNDDYSSSRRRAKADRTWDSTAMAALRSGLTVRFQPLKKQDKRGDVLSVASRRGSGAGPGISMDNKLIIIIVLLFFLLKKKNYLRDSLHFMSSNLSADISGGYGSSSSESLSLSLSRGETQSGGSRRKGVASTSDDCYPWDSPSVGRATSNSWVSRASFALTGTHSYWRTERKRISRPIR